MIHLHRLVLLSSWLPLPIIEYNTQHIDDFTVIINQTNLYISGGKFVAYQTDFSVKKLCILLRYSLYLFFEIWRCLLSQTEFSVTTSVPQ